MKLIYAVVSDDDSHMVSKQLTKNNFFATKLASTGGFLMSGNTTFMICTEDDRVKNVIDLIRVNSQKRTQMIPTPTAYGEGVFSTTPLEITVGGATIFVTNVEHFEKI